MFQRNALLLTPSSKLEWSIAEHEELVQLFLLSKELMREEEEVMLVYALSKPDDSSEDPLDNMLNSESFRFEFERKNPLYLQMKENQRQYNERFEALMIKNLLFRVFALVEKKQTLQENYGLFKRYQTREDILLRLDEIQKQVERFIGKEGELNLASFSYPKDVFRKVN